MQTVSAKKPLGKLWSNKVLTYITKHNPLRGELMEVEMKVVGRSIVYTYTKVRERH